MSNSSDKKAQQLGMPVGTASNRLRKMVLFRLLKETKQNFCFQCGAEVEGEEELSMEHKIPYLDSSNPKELFFDLDNIAFSHLNCNVSAARRKEATHPSVTTYNNGCRCTKCREKSLEQKQRYRKRKKERSMGLHDEDAPLSRER